MQVQLPYDIWHYIASFLDRKTLVQLYGVCSVLFDIAMDEMYKEVEIYSFALERLEMIRMFNLSTPNAKRVRTVALHLSFEPPNLGKITSSNLHVQANEMNKKAYTMIKVFADNIRSMENVDSLNIFSQGHQEIQEYRESLSSSLLLQASWEAFGKNLRSLMISLSPEEFIGVFEDAPLLPCLAVLSIDLNTAYLTTDYPKIYSTALLSFIHRHKGTLRTLMFSLAFTGHTINPFDLLLGMEHLPFLQNLSIASSTKYFRKENSFLEAILSTHARQLRVLNFRLYEDLGEPTSMAEWFMPRFLGVRLPLLQELDLRLFSNRRRGYMTQFVNKLSGYLQPLHRSLTSLKIQQYRFTIRELASILPSPEAGQISSLQRLDVHVRCVCPALLKILRQSLPNLRNLNLEYEELVDANGVGGLAMLGRAPIEVALGQYLCEVKQHGLADWSLRYLEVPQVAKNFGCVNDLQEYILCRAFPSVIWFNGAWRGEVLRRLTI